jgi:hypothetical protein
MGINACAFLAFPQEVWMAVGASSGSLPDPALRALLQTPSAPPRGLDEA